MKFQFLVLFILGVTTAFSQTLIATSKHPQATAYHNQRKIVRDSEDNIYIVYQDSTENETSIYGVWFDREIEIWSNPFFISRGKSPNIAIDS
jgi:lipoprotein-anchoring transpeptidase ErfK/SrfK